MKRDFDVWVFKGLSEVGAEDLQAHATLASMLDNPADVPALPSGMLAHIELGHETSRNFSEEEITFYLKTATLHHKFHQITALQEAADALGITETPVVATSIPLAGPALQLTA